MKKIRTSLSLLLCLGVIALGLAACDFSGGYENGDPDGQDVFQIGTIQMVEHPAFDAALNGFVAALEDEGIQVRFDQQNAQGDPNTLSAIAQIFVNNNVDLVLALGTGSAQAIANETEDIPIVGTAITNYVIAGLVDSNEMPGSNITGASDLQPIETQINMIAEFVPGVETIGLLFSSNEPNSIYQAEIAQAVIESMGLAAETATVTTTGDIQQVATSLASQVDAIWVPTDNTIANAMGFVGQISLDTNTPVFAAERGMVMGGGVATYSVDYFALGMQSGRMAAQILRGEGDPATMPIQFAEGFHYVVNGDMIEALGIVVPERFTDYVVDVE